ncbi:MAG: DUF2851 family protein [Ignavibacteria bacterium]
MKLRNSIKSALDSIHERDIQKRLHAYLMLGQHRSLSTLGHSICILNPGKINPYAGPDFLNMAVLINGELSVGNGEFHRRTSDWFAHGHHLDIHYQHLLLHIVFDNDISCEISKETIIITEECIPMNAIVEKGNSLHSLDDLQDYALSRLLRKRDEVNKIADSFDDPMQLLKLCGLIFLERRVSLRKRHSHVRPHKAIIGAFITSQCIQECLKGKNLPCDISKVDFQARGGLSKYMYMELFVNCFAPLALLLEIGDQQAFKSWYWTQPSLSVYHSLYASFPDIPQLFMWQQQGVLEWQRHVFHGRNTIKELLYPYHAELMWDE